MKPKLILTTAIAGLLAAFIVVGCSTPGKVAHYLFDFTTNTVATVAQVTNTVERTEIATNATGQVVVQPVRELVVMSKTNLVGEIDVKPSAALQSWSGLAATFGDSIAPGVGKGILAALGGMAGLYAVNTRRKLNAAYETQSDIANEGQTSRAIAENFAQSIETLREVIKATPQLKPLDDKIVSMLQRNQMTVGLVQEAATIVRNSVSNESAKRAAQKILDLLPKEAAAAGA